MVRTQIQLTEAQARGLKELAEREDVSMAELIRNSVDKLLLEKGAVRSAEVKRRALAMAGCVLSGLPDLAREHDKYLVEAYTR